MSLSYVQYVADGTTDEFDVTFPFADRTHVKVKVNGSIPVLPIRWVGENRIKITGDIPSGSLVELRRETPISSRLVDFQNGSVLTEEELDIAINQVFYLQQELKDLYEDTLKGRLAAIANGGGYVIPPGADIVDELAYHVIATEAAQALSQAIGNIAQNSNGLATLVLESTALNDGLQAATAAIEQAEAAQASLETSLTATINTVDGRITTLRADHESLVSLVDSLAGGDPGSGIATLIQDETTARIAGDTAITTTLNLIGAKSGDNLSFILNTGTVRVSPTETLAQRFSALSATDANNAAAIITEQTARVNAIASVVSSVNLLDTRLDDAEASILTESNARSAADNALASSITALTTRVGTAEANIISEASASVTRDNALTSSLNALTARVSTAEASIITNNNARISGDTALSESLNALSARVTTAEASIVTVDQARASGDSALTQSLNTLTSRVTTAEATIVSDRQARVDGDAALAADISLLGAKNAGSTAFVLNTGTVQIGGGETLATRFSSLAASDTNQLALINNEVTARINGDNALAATIALLGASNGSNTAFILDTSKVQIGGGETLAARFSSIGTTTGSLQTQINNEVTARINGDNALASTLSLLGAASGDNTAFILDTSKVQIGGGETLATRLSSISSSLNGNTTSINSLTTSVNGLNAKYVVTIDTNNNAVAGFSLAGGGGSVSTFRIMADKFELVTPGTNFKPFYVDNGVTYIENAVIKSGDVSDLDYYFSSFGTFYSSSTNVWHNTGASVTVTAPAGAVGVMLDLCAQLDRGGSSDDTLSFRIMRGDGTVLPQVYASCKVEGGRRPYAFKFTDPSPAQGTNTYTLQVLSSDDWPTWYDTTLTAALFKK